MKFNHKEIKRLIKIVELENVYYGEDIKLLGFLIDYYTKKENFEHNINCVCDCEGVEE